MKKYLILVIIVLVVAGLVVGGYLLRKNSSTAPESVSPDDNQSPLPNGTSGESPSAGTGQGSLGGLIQKSNQVAPNLVKDYFVDTQEKVIFVQPDGQIFEAGGKEPKTINSTAIDGLIDASFSFDGKIVAARFGNPENPQTSIFDIDGKTWMPIALNIQALAWAPGDHRVAYLAKTAQGLTLGTLDLSQKSAKPKEFTSLHANDLNLTWIRPEEIWLVEKASAQIANSLWVFDFSKKTLTPIIKNQKGLEIMWNASGTLALELSDGQLKLINRQGVLARRFTFVTLPSKCAFYFEIRNVTATSVATGTKKTIVPQIIKEEYLNCAIPVDENQLKGYSLPDDYYKKAIFTEDNIHQIKISTGEIIPVFVGDEIDATNLKRVGQKIYFINRFDGKLYSAPIKSN
ncbi:MAG: hypothetical protein AAB738_00725 [Patescibacteria group bacterium]